MVVRGLFIFLAYAYVARVPILCGAALVLLRYAAFSGQNFAADLLNGLFDIDPLPGGVIVALCAVFFVASAVITTDIIVCYAHARFDVADLHDWWGANARSSPMHNEF